MADIDPNELFIGHRLDENDPNGPLTLDPADLTAGARRPVMGHAFHYVAGGVATRAADSPRRDATRSWRLLRRRHATRQSLRGEYSEHWCCCRTASILL